MSLLRTIGKSGRLPILKLLFEAPARRRTLNELAEAAGVPLATAWRAFQDLKGLGLVRAERIGKTLAITLNQDSPATAAIAALEWPDPHRLAYEAFRKRVQRAAPNLKVKLFGSVAADTHRPGSDIDVRVAYGGTHVPRAKAEGLCARAAVEVMDRFDLVVSPIVMRRLPETP